jgi:tetratricopeptide (TPR) repeat protein
VVQRLTGDHPAATASLTQALELFRDLGDRHGQAGALINLGELLLVSSEYREARGYFTQALGIARGIDTPVEEAKALEAIGRSHVQEGNRGQGAADIQQALAIYRRIGAPEAQHARDSFLYQPKPPRAAPLAYGDGSFDQASLAAPDSPCTKT